MPKMKVGTQIKIGAIFMASIMVGGFTLSSSPLKAQPVSETPVESTLAERLEKRKQAYPVKLNGAQLSSLKARCKASQEKLAPVRDKVIVVQKNRINAYDTLHDRINGLISTVGGQADTSKLVQQLTEYETRVDKMEIALANYRQALNDLIEVDCTADPKGFKSSLEEARTLLTQVLQAATDIRQLIQDSIKPSLVSLRQELRDKQGDVIN